MKNTDDLKNDKNLNQLLGKGMIELNDISFEDKVMKKIEMVKLQKEQNRRNIRLSWIFLIISMILLPTSFILLSDQHSIISETLSNTQIISFGTFLKPAGMILFSIIIFLQIDNLYRMNIKKRLI